MRLLLGYHFLLIKKRTCYAFFHIRAIEILKRTTLLLITVTIQTIIKGRNNATPILKMVCTSNVYQRPLFEDKKLTSIMKPNS